MPPRWRSKCVQPRTRRVDKWRNCAISTCSLPSKERARCAKISRITPVRSSTRHSSSFSKLRSWAGDRLRSNSTTSAVVALTTSRISAALPIPTKYLGSGLILRATTVATGTTPAETASSANSAASPNVLGPAISTLTRIARSPPRGRSNKLGELGHALIHLPVHRPRAAA